jgi:hypothetical protein
MGIPQGYRNCGEIYYSLEFFRNIMEASGYPTVDQVSLDYYREICKFLRGSTFSGMP